MHQKKQQVEHVSKCLKHLQTDVGRGRSSVEELQWLEPSNQGCEAKDGEVNREVNLDENEDFLD